MRQWIKLQATTERERMLRWALEQALAVKDREIFRFILFFLKPISRSFEKQFEFSFFCQTTHPSKSNAKAAYIFSNMFLPYDIFYLNKKIYYFSYIL
jgi:hypothetical protein